MSTNMDVNVNINAKDNASSVISNVGSNAKDLMVNFSGLATSAFALYGGYERVETSQVALDRANVTLERSDQNVKTAQENLNTATAKYSADSPQVVDAANKLSIAIDAQKVASERADLAVRNHNDSFMSFGLSVVPTAITAVSSISKIIDSLRGSQEAAAVATDVLSASEGVGAVAADSLAVSETAGAATTGVFGGALTALGGVLDFLSANPIVLVIAAIAAVAIGLYEAYEHCGPFRDAVNEIGRVLGGALSIAINDVKDALEWLWNNIFVPLGKFLEEDFAVQIKVLQSVWNAFASGLSWAYNNLIKPVFDALAWVYDHVLKPIADFFGTVGNALKGVSSAVSGAFSSVGKALGFAEGGIVTQPTFAMVGEAGPEAVIPLSRGGGAEGYGATTYNISIPINVQGKVDEQILQKMKAMLNTVVVEATSQGVPVTQKRIIQGSVF